MVVGSHSNHARGVVCRVVPNAGQRRAVFEDLPFSGDPPVHVYTATLVARLYSERFPNLPALAPSGGRAPLLRTAFATQDTAAC